MTIPIRQLDEDNYSALKKAVTTENVALVSMVRKCDGANVAVVCIKYSEFEGDGICFVPLAVMVEGSQRDMLYEPFKETDSLEYTLCKHCDHFVAPNDNKPEEGVTFAEWIHLDSGEKEHEHDAEPGKMKKTLLAWKQERPDLFVTFPDGYIGPNSEYFTHSLE